MSDGKHHHKGRKDKWKKGHSTDSDHGKHWDHPKNKNKEETTTTSSPFISATTAESTHPTPPTPTSTIVTATSTSLKSTVPTATTSSTSIPAHPVPGNTDDVELIPPTVVYAETTVPTVTAETLPFTGPDVFGTTILGVLALYAGVKTILMVKKQGS